MMGAYIRPPATSEVSVSSLAVLVVGVYLADRENTAEATVAELHRSSEWKVEQRWASLGVGPSTHTLEQVTVCRVASMTPKFVLLNRILANTDLSLFAFVIVCDDDVELPAGFLDDYLRLIGTYDFALGQPARTHASYIEHWFVEQRAGLTARQTRFVEIGPLFSIRQDAFSVLLPFDESSPMGWGYDLVWPRVMEQAGLKLGIIDATAVGHSLRKPTAAYDYKIPLQEMDHYLKTRSHLSRDEAFTTLESYAMPAHKDTGRETGLLGFVRPIWRRVRPPALP